MVLFIGCKYKVKAYNNGLKEVNKMKKVISYFLVIAIALGNLSLYALANSENRKTLIALYDFEEESFVEGSLITDSSGNKYHGIVTGGDLGSAKGIYGKGVDFNGNGYVSLPGELLNELKEKGAFTVNALVQKNRVQNQFLFSASKEHKTSTKNSIGIIDGLNYRYEANGIDYIRTNLRNENDTEYVFLTAVFDFETGVSALYIDGEKKGEGAITQTLIDVEALVCGIGVSPWNDPYYNGLVDFFAIYDGAMTDSEVHNIAAKMAVTPIYTDVENGREYRGEAVRGFTGTEISFPARVKDGSSFYNYTALDNGSLAYTVEYSNTGECELVIECSSEKNAAFKIADELVIRGGCSAGDITLPEKVEGHENSEVTWTCSDENVKIEGDTIAFSKGENTNSTILTATIVYEDELCTKDFEVLIHAKDATPKQGDRAADINGLGYVAVNNENLIDKSKFDYTCNSYTGWTSGNEPLDDNFSIGEGYNDCSAIFAKKLTLSTEAGSINPYIPLPEHDGEETFILTFAAYGTSGASVEWSKISLCDENGNITTTVKGDYDGANYKNGVKVAENWQINCVAFTPSERDKFIRIMIGWAENIGIDNISIVKAEKLMIAVSERYVDNTTAYDENPVVFGTSEKGYLIQYGEVYKAESIPEGIVYEGEEYVLISDKNSHKINSEGDSQVFDYKYAKTEDIFLHPGVLNTAEDLDRLAKKVKDREEPYLSAYNAMITNSYAQIGNPRAAEVISRGGTGDNCALLYKDAARAYFCAIRWKIEGDTAYGDCARDILNAWSDTLRTVTGNADRYLASGLYGYEITAAAEIMRDYPGFELDRMQEMLIKVFYKPLIERFLYSNEYGSDHNGANITNYWANWDLCNMAAATAIGVFCDRRDIYDRAVEYYKFGPGNGAIFNAVPKLYEAEAGVYNIPLGQWQEAGRDMPHTELGIGIMATMCEIAWNQGDDLYGWANNRFMYGAEYIAEYEIGNDVPFTIYNWRSGQGSGSWSEHSVIAGRGNTRAVWEMIYNHYVNRMGYELPGIEAIAAAARPEEGPGSHASSFDYFGFGTLLYTREYDESIEKAKLPEGSLKEGIYRITCKKTGGALTDVEGSVLQYAEADANASQLWEISDLGGGIYTVTNASSGKTMCVENGSYANGALIKTDDYSGKFSQQFAFLTFNDECDNYYKGYYRIVPVHSGLSIDVMNGKNDDGTEILQYTYGTADNQQWELTLVEEKNTEPPEKVNTAIEVKLQNDSAENKVFVVYNAVFNKEGILVNIKSERIELLPNTERLEVFKLWVEQNEHAKTFVWNEKMHPLENEGALYYRHL